MFIPNIIGQEKNRIKGRREKFSRAEIIIFYIIKSEDLVSKHINIDQLCFLCISSQLKADFYCIPIPILSSSS